MIDLEQIVSFYPEPMRPYKRNILREYLQYKVLELIFRSRAGGRLYFMGGTCIHIIHGNPRFSEDLDFDNRGLSRNDLEDLSSEIMSGLKREGYDIEITNTFRDAFRAHIRFRGVLQAAGLSPHASEKLLLHIDAEPQDFDYDPEKIILNKFDVFTRINTVPADLLLAQKFACILGRNRPMGRDFFDAVFLMGKTRPRIEYLRSKFGIEDVPVLKRRLLEKSEELDLDHLARDVEPFLVNENDVMKIKQFSQYISDNL